METEVEVNTAENEGKAPQLASSPFMEHLSSYSVYTLLLCAYPGFCFHHKIWYCVSVYAYTHACHICTLQAVN